MNDKKPFNILVIRNSIKEYDLSDDLNKFSEWMQRHTPLFPVFHFIDSELDNLTHKPFLTDATGKIWFGLDGIKERLNGLDVVRDGLYKAVVFLYDFKDTQYPKGEGVTRAGGWCYFNLYKGGAFIEVPILDGLEKLDDIYRVLTHEVIHGFHRLLWDAGTNTKDDMDLYDFEFNIEAPTGNRARNLATLSPYWNIVQRTPKVRSILMVLASFVPQLKNILEKIEQSQKEKLEAPRSRLQEWADAIEEYEGFYPGSRAFRNHNPGNLKLSKFTDQQDAQGFCIFPDYRTGRIALIHQLTIACNGKSKVYKPTDTLVDFFRKYAPVFDKNEPNSYAEFVSKKLGVKPNVEIRTLL